MKSLVFISVFALLIVGVSACGEGKKAPAQKPENPIEPFGSVKIGVFDAPLQDATRHVEIPSAMTAYLKYVQPQTLGVNWEFPESDTPGVVVSAHGLQVSSAAHQIYNGPIVFFPVAITGEIGLSAGERVAGDFMNTVNYAILHEGIQIINLSMGTTPQVWTALSADEIDAQDDLYGRSNFVYDPNRVIPPLRSSLEAWLTDLSENSDVVIVFALGNDGYHEFGGTFYPAAQLRKGSSAIRFDLVKRFPKLFIVAGEYQKLPSGFFPVSDSVSKLGNDVIGDRLIFAKTPVDYFGQKTEGSSIAAPQIAAAIAKVKNANKALSTRAAAQIVLESADAHEPMKWQSLAGKDNLNYMGRGVLNIEKALQWAQKEP